MAKFWHLGAFQALNDHPAFKHLQIEFVGGFDHGQLNVYSIDTGECLIGSHDPQEIISFLANEIESSVTLCRFGEYESKLVLSNHNGSPTLKIQCLKNTDQGAVPVNIDDANAGIRLYFGMPLINNMLKLFGQTPNPV